MLLAPRAHDTAAIGAYKQRAALEIAPGTSRTRSENHATRPSSHVMAAATHAWSAEPRRKDRTLHNVASKLVRPCLAAWRGHGLATTRQVPDIFAGDVANARSISGLVAEYIVAIDVTRVRFPADAFDLRLLPPTRKVDLGIRSASLSHPSRVRWRAALVTCDGISKHCANMTAAGLEPAMPGSVGRCLIHWATGPSDSVEIGKIFSLVFLASPPTAAIIVSCVLLWARAV